MLEDGCRDAEFALVDSFHSGCFYQVRKKKESLKSHTVTTKNNILSVGLYERRTHRECLGGAC